MRVMKVLSPENQSRVSHFDPIVSMQQRESLNLSQPRFLDPSPRDGNLLSACLLGLGDS